MQKKTTTRILNLLLTLVMVLGLLPGTAWATEDERIQIASAEDLASFRDRVNAGETTLNAKLTEDIVLNGLWTPFHPASGYVTDAYAGTFDGGGHTIKGLRIQDDSTNGVGFFGTVNGATIKNLSIEGNVAASNSAFVGGIVGKTAGATTVEGCSFSGSVVSEKAGSNAGAGGIAGRVNAGTVTIRCCVNSAVVSGGCAAGILGYCTSANNVIENCYNTGTISGGSRTGGIAGQVSKTTELTSCFTVKGAVCGLNGNLTNCYDESNPPNDASQLGSAFTVDANGSIILSWQAGAAPAPKDPKITIHGPAVLYDTNSGAKPKITLTASYVDMAPTPVQWTVEQEQPILQLETPDNVDKNNSTISVQAVAPGKATVKAEAGSYSAELEITVFPFVTTVEIAGVVAVGETVSARVNVLGGSELDYAAFPVKVQWKYKNSAADISFQDIPNATHREFTITEEYAGTYLSFTCQYQNEDKSPSSPSLVKGAGETQPDPLPPTADPSLDEALEWYTMSPVFGQDTNVNQVLERYLADKGLEGFTAAVQSVTEVYGGAGIARDGTITYFYADPNAVPAIRFGSYKVTFALSKDSETLEKEIPIILYWDAARVRETMRQEISSKVALPTGDVAGDLSLPKAVDGKTWTLISWQSSNEEIISIRDENHGTANTLFDPYVGVVKQSETDQQVTLTATFTFQLTSDVTSGEAPITLVSTYPVTVPALDNAQEEQIRAGLLAKLNAGFDKKGLSDFVTGEQLMPGENGVYIAANDIQFPTTRDFGVDGKYYPVTIITSNNATLKAPDVSNAARVEIRRPGVGQPDAVGTITVILHDRDTSVTASKAFNIQVPALTQSEIDAELALMERVKALYFEGIRGSNDAKDNVCTNLVPFLEVREEDGQLVWARTREECTGRGIVPVPIEGWEDLELWRLFQSSNPNVISHENLIVTRQTEAKAVTITSRLSSETLGRYGELYVKDPEKYSPYEALAPLYYQEATTCTSTQPAIRTAQTAALLAQPLADTIVVRGTRNPDSALPVVETVDNVTFSLIGLDGKAWIPPTALTGLDESSTVYDVFVKMLGQDYTATRVKGTYIKAISGPNGSLAEKDHGEASGWMYRINGRIPDVYMGACPLHSGDTIQVFYTRDAKTDDPNWDWPSGGNSSSNGGTSNGSSPNSGSSAGGASNAGFSGSKTEPSSHQTVQVEKSALGDSYIVTLPKNSKGPHLVTIPDVTTGQLVVIVCADGREEVIKKSILENGRAKFLLEQDATIKVRDAVVFFEDVMASAWYSSAVGFAAGRGLFTGVSPSSFAPDLPLSRGMLATVLFHLEGGQAQKTESVFLDAANDAWYTPGITWAVETGIVSGYGDGYFGPNDSITREQLAVMLFRYAQLLDMSTGGRDSLTGFSDRDAISPWAQEAVAWTVDSGIISGLPNGTLVPSGTATRAEAAAMLQRFISALLK